MYQGAIQIHPSAISIIPLQPPRVAFRIFSKKKENVSPWIRASATPCTHARRYVHVSMCIWIYMCMHMHAYAWIFTRRPDICVWIYVVIRTYRRNRYICRCVRMYGFVVKGLYAFTYRCLHSSVQRLYLRARAPSQTSAFLSQIFELTLGSRANLIPFDVLRISRFKIAAIDWVRRKILLRILY